MMTAVVTLDSSKLIIFEDRDLYKQNAISFLIDYIAKKSLIESKCSECTKVLIKPVEEVSSNEIFTQCKEYPHADKSLPSISYLTRPSLEFCKIVIYQLYALDKKHASLLHQRKILVWLTEEIKHFWMKRVLSGLIKIIHVINTNRSFKKCILKF